MAQSDLTQELQRAAQNLQRGAVDEAYAALASLVGRHPDNADALNLLGIASSQRDDDEAAAVALERAAQLEPLHPGVQLNRGNVLRRLGRLDDAVESYRAAIALRPDMPAAQRNLGETLVGLRRYQEAVAPLNAAAQLLPNHPAAYLGRARAARGLGNNPAALFDIDNVLRLDPANVDALLLRAGIKRGMGQREEALADCERALALDDANWSIHNNRGVLLDELGRSEEALACFEHSLKLNPDDPDTFLNIGTALVGLKRAEEAIRKYDVVLAQSPFDISALNAKGIVYLALRRFEEALHYFERAISAQSDSAVSNFHRALALLAMGRFDEGFEAYEWRLRGETYSGPRFRQPTLQKGEDVSGKTMLLFSEQGLGDIIHFSRFARQFSDRGAKVVLATYPPLTRLLGSLGDDIVVVPPEGPAPEFDLTCPLMSAAHVLGTTITTIPADVPYLKAPDEAIEAWRERMEPYRQTLRVGLAWSGNPHYTNDANRSVAFAQMKTLLDIDGITFVSLQKDVRTGDDEPLARSSVLDFRNEFTDMAETAGLIAQLDLVITVDTSVAHLSGAMGKPVWIMLSAVSDWRWLHGRDDSPWYPSARLFRQATLGVWEPVLADVRARLATLARGRGR